MPKYPDKRTGPPEDVPAHLLEIHTENGALNSGIGEAIAVRSGALAGFTAALFLLVSAMVPINTANAGNYTLTSLASEGDQLSNVNLRLPSINNFGEVAYGHRVFDPIDNRQERVIIVDDGTGPFVLVSLTDAGLSGTSRCENGGLSQGQGLGLRSSGGVSPPSP